VPPEFCPTKVVAVTGCSLFVAGIRLATIEDTSSEVSRPHKRKLRPSQNADTKTSVVVYHKREKTARGSTSSELDFLTYGRNGPDEVNLGQIAEDLN
jgi:hypothetical protein